MAEILKSAEELLSFAEHATEEDQLAMDALVNFLRDETMPPKGSIQAWAVQPYLVPAALLTRGVPFTSEVGERYARMETAIQKYKAENPAWLRRERMLHPDDPRRTVAVVQYRAQRLRAARLRAAS